MKLQDIDFRVWLKSDKRYIALNSEIDFPHEYGTMKTNKGKMFAIYKCNREFDKFSNIEIEFWTGLKDENGNKIYEGDIVTFEADSHDMGILTIAGEVAFKNGRFIIKGYEHFFPHYSFFDFISRYKDIRIIGNIHENPELLESLEN